MQLHDELDGKDPCVAAHFALQDSAMALEPHLVPKRK